MELPVFKSGSDHKGMTNYEIELVVANSFDRGMHRGREYAKEDFKREHPFINWFVNFIEVDYVCI